MNTCLMRMGCLPWRGPQAAAYLSCQSPALFGDVPVVEFSFAPKSALFSWSSHEQAASILSRRIWSALTCTRTVKQAVAVRMVVSEVTNCHSLPASDRNGVGAVGKVFLTPRTRVLLQRPAGARHVTPAQNMSRPLQALLPVWGVTPCARLENHR